MLKIDSLLVYKSKKIISFKKAKLLIQTLKKQGKKVGMCQGGFDLLHLGQVKHFESSKKLCDILLVSVTSDRYVGERKGIGRPIFTDSIRAYMIASLECVDCVVVADFKGIDVIKMLKPSFYIKGPDFVNKQTPGIIAERKAIKQVGGEMKYTQDPKLSTTEIIKYIQTQIKTPCILLILDRDGTLIHNDDFFGKAKTWKKELKLNESVISFISYLQTKYRTTKIVISNQAGVARGYFDTKRVEIINTYLNGLLIKRGIKVDAWHFCPDVDSKFASKNPEIKFISKYIKSVTERKPKTTLVLRALASINQKISDYDEIIVLGDRQEDELLAVNLESKFINVAKQTYAELLEKFKIVSTIKI